MPNPQKDQVVAELRETVAKSKGAILTEYRGLTVAEVTTLRKRLREHQAEYHVVKNTLFKIALGDKLDPELDQLLAGPTAIAFTMNDPVAPAKVVLDFLREVKKSEVKVKGGWIDGRIYDVDQVTALSKLPAKEVLVAQLIGSLNAPASNLVGTLNGIVSEFVRTLQAIADQRGEQAA
jgi:large subunit ribosomal protein L10